MRHLLAAAAAALLATPAAAAGPGGTPSPALLLPVSFEDRVAVSGASAVIRLDRALVLIDPVGPQANFRPYGRPDIVVLTGTGPEHLGIDTMIGLLRRDTVVLAPQAVIDRLPLMIANNVITPFEVGMAQVVDGITFRALPPDAAAPPGTPVYPRLRGDYAVAIEVDGARALF